MSHDLLMIIYGAAIGTGSSIITTIIQSLFQSWIERREYKRRILEEEKSELRKIQIPTLNEINAITNETYPGINMNEPLSKLDRPPNKHSVIGLIPIALCICCSTVLLIYWTQNPIVYFVASGLITFFVTSLTIGGIIRLATIRAKQDV